MALLGKIFKINDLFVKIPLCDSSHNLFVNKTAAAEKVNLKFFLEFSDLETDHKSLSEADEILEPPGASKQTTLRLTC